MECDGIDLTFNNERELGFSHRLDRFIEPEEKGGLVEDGGIICVDVFSSLVIGAKDSSAEAHDIAVVVQDGEHELIVELGVEPGARVFLIAHTSESGINEFTSVESFFLHEREKLMRVPWSVADEPFLGGLLGEAAGFQVVPGMLGVG
jgi:hypothetical protein